MPLPAVPLVLGAVALFGAVFGTVKVVEAIEDFDEAEDLDNQAKDVLKNAQRRLKGARTRCTKELDALGQLKLDIWDRQLGRFAFLFGQLRNLELVGSPEMDRLGALTVSKEDLAYMTRVSGFASEAIAGGAAALGAGALAGMAGYGGAAMFATASTGTVISSLSGVAATNATLAWFGGGSLATGGLGMAGGTIVLGGFVAGPVLGVGGFVLSAKASKRLAEARMNHAKAQEMASECAAAATVVNGIRKAANQVRRMIAGLDERTTPILGDLESVLAANGTDYSTYPEADRRTVHLAWIFAQGLKGVLDTPFLTKKGALSKSGLNKALKEGRRLLTIEQQRVDFSER